MAAPDDQNLPDRQTVSVDRFENEAADLGGPFLGVGGRLSGGALVRNGGRLIDMRPRNRILSFDPGTGVIDCEAGVTLRAVVGRAAAQRFFLPVTAGSAAASVGGLAAANPAGRNRMQRGCFSEHVRSLRLMRSSGEVLTCSRRDNAELFAATLGGYGLTGLILSVELQLMKVPSAHVQRHTLRFSTPEDGLALARERAEIHEYAWAWLDRAGRGVVIAADHADAGSELPDMPKRRRLPLTVPLQPWFFHPHIVQAAGRIAWHATGGGDAAKTVAWWDFFWPLEAWPWTGGARLLAAFRRFAVDVPPEASAEFLEACRTALRTTGRMPVLTEFRPGSERDGFLLVFPEDGRATTALIGQLAAIARMHDARRLPVDIDLAGEEAWLLPASLEDWRDPRFAADLWATGEN